MKSAILNPHHYATILILGAEIVYLLVYVFYACEFVVFF